MRVSGDKRRKVLDNLDNLDRSGNLERSGNLDRDEPSKASNRKEPEDS